MSTRAAIALCFLHSAASQHYLQFGIWNGATRLVLAAQWLWSAPAKKGSSSNSGGRAATAKEML